MGKYVSEKLGEYSQVKVEIGDFSKENSSKLTLLASFDRKYMNRSNLVVLSLKRAIDEANAIRICRKTLKKDEKLGLVGMNLVNSQFRGVLQEVPVRLMTKKQCIELLKQKN